MNKKSSNFTLGRFIPVSRYNKLILLSSLDDCVHDEEFTAADTSTDNMRSANILKKHVSFSHCTGPYGRKVIINLF